MRPMITLWMISGLTALSAGCASPAPPPLEDRTLSMGEAPIADLLGLSQSELTARLGGETSERVYARRLHLEERSTSSQSWVFTMMRDACAQDLDPPYFRSAELSRPYAEGPRGGVNYAHFQDGAFIGFSRVIDAPPDEWHSQDTVVRLICHVGGQPTDDYTRALIPFAVASLPVTGPLMVASHLEEERRRDILAELELGSAPPGGLDAFLGRTADFVTLADQSDGRAELRLLLKPHERQVRRVTATVILEDGIVRDIAIDGSVRCHVTANRALRCDGFDAPA